MKPRKYIKKEVIEVDIYTLRILIKEYLTNKPNKELGTISISKLIGGFAISFYVSNSKGKTVDIIKKSLSDKNLKYSEMFVLGGGTRLYLYKEDGERLIREILIKKEFLNKRYLPEIRYKENAVEVSVKETIAFFN